MVPSTWCGQSWMARTKAILDSRMTRERRKSSQGASSSFRTVMPSESRRGCQERRRTRDLLIERTHGDVKRFHPHADGFVPCSRIQFPQIAFVIQCRQPVDALHGTCCCPCLVKVGQRVGIESALEGEDFHPHRPKTLGERLAYAAAVRHHDNAARAVEFHAGGFAEVQRRTQDW